MAVNVEAVDELSCAVYEDLYLHKYRGLLALHMLVEVIAPFPTQMHVCLHACLFK